VHLVGFTTEIYYNAWPCKRQIWYSETSFNFGMYPFSAYGATGASGYLVYILRG